jgi:hypothetical protein
MKRTPSMIKRKRKRKHCTSKYKCHRCAKIVNLSQILKRLWNYCNVLWDDGMSCLSVRGMNNLSMNQVILALQNVRVIHELPLQHARINKKDDPYYAYILRLIANRWKTAPEAHSRIYPSIF